jgi:F-type H+-transporting ATPase subunit a
MAGQPEEHSEGAGNFILEHIVDHHELHFGSFHIPLPHLELYGIDMSITGHLAMMWVASILLVVSLILSTRRRGLVPSGFSNAIEALVVFIRDDVAVPNLGKKEGAKFLPFLLTIFLFILSCNLLGLIPFGQTPTGNINVTATLAVITFVVMIVSGIMHNGLFGFFKGLIPPGLPVFLLPLMVPMELLGLLTKPFALCIRLFANMLAGHVVILSLIGIIFILKTLFVAPISIAFALAMYMLEIFVAFLQAYVFTLLSGLFIGMSIHQEH